MNSDNAERKKVTRKKIIGIVLIVIAVLIFASFVVSNMRKIDSQNQHNYVDTGSLRYTFGDALLSGVNLLTGIPLAIGIYLYVNAVRSKKISK